MEDWKRFSAGRYYVRNTFQFLFHCSKAGCKVDTKSYKTLAYADDIALLLPSKTGLQLLIDNVSEFLAETILCINAEKSSYIIFRSKNHRCLGHQSNLWDNRSLM